MICFGSFPALLQGRHRFVRRNICSLLK